MSRPYIAPTAQERADAADFFDLLKESDIRRRQDINAIEIRLAHDKGDLDALARLRDVEADLMAAMLRRC